MNNSQKKIHKGSQTYEMMLNFVREIRIKTTLKYNLVPIWSTFKSLTMHSVHGVLWKNTLIYCCSEYKMVQPHMEKKIWQYLVKLHRIPLRIYPENL